MTGFGVTPQHFCSCLAGLTGVLLPRRVVLLLSLAVLKRLRALEEEAEQRRAAKKSSKGFSGVGLEEVQTIFDEAGIVEGDQHPLPDSVVAEAATLNLAPDLPYQWADGEKEPDATPHFLSILTKHLAHSVVDSKSVVLPCVSTEDRDYHGFTDGAVLPQGYSQSTTFVLPVAAAFLEFKEPDAFKTPSAHVPQSLLELLATRRPVFTTDMSLGFKAWVLEGNTFRPFHGAALLTLAEGIALMLYYVRKADAEVAARKAAGAPGGPALGGATGSGAGSGSGSSAADSGQQPPSSSDAQPAGGASRGTTGSGRRRLMSAATECTLQEDNIPVDYDDYKMRILLFAQVLRHNGVDVPDRLLARLR